MVGRLSQRGKATNGFGGRATSSKGPLRRGMTLRDYFAARALEAFLVTRENNLTDLHLYAAWAYQAADEMIKAREKQ